MVPKYMIGLKSEVFTENNVIPWFYETLDEMNDVATAHFDIENPAAGTYRLSDITNEDILRNVSLTARDNKGIILTEVYGDIEIEVPSGAASLNITVGNDTFSTAEFIKLCNTIRLSGNTYREVCKNWSADLSIKYTREDEEAFLRKELDGSLKFLASDYEYIMQSDFEETKYIKIWAYEKSQDGNNASYYTWKEIFAGKFFMTDCEVDTFRKTIEAEIETEDEYTEILNCIDKEYDLMKLPIAIESLTYYKRTAVQIYRLGSDKIGWYIGGLYWETDVKNIITDANALRQNYFFATSLRHVELKLTANGPASTEFNGIYTGSIDDNALGTLTNSETGDYITITKPNPDQLFWYMDLYKADGTKTPYHWGDNMILVTSTRYLRNNGSSTDYYKAEIIRSDYFTRLMTDVDSISNTATHNIPSDDIVEYNRNYSKCIGIILDNSVWGWSRLSDEPTEWGKTPDGLYYTKPGLTAYPIVKTEWIWSSVWFIPTSVFDFAIEPNSRKEYELRDAYELSSCIQAILTKAGVPLTHKNTSQYSEFLYGNNPFGPDFRIFITQKSNILNGEYTEPAQKAPVTLRQIFDMLKYCYNCYWYVEDGMLKIEHIYTIENDLDLDTVYIDSLNDRLNKKSWLYDNSKYKFKKADMPARYEYSWMDDVSEMFKGLPVEMISKFVQEDNVEKISVDKFTSDIDLMLLNPSSMSNDGFALFAAENKDGKYMLPILQLDINGIDYTLQNGYAAFCYMQPTYLYYGMPASRLKINDEEMLNGYVYKGKEQELTIPLPVPISDFNSRSFIETNIGKGQIEEASIKLSTLMAEFTLKFPTVEIDVRKKVKNIF